MEFRSSLIGFIFLGICLLLSAFFASGVLTVLPEYVHGILSEGFNIIGWIALWHPVEAFLYDGLLLQYRKCSKVKGAIFCGNQHVFLNGGTCMVEIGFPDSVFAFG